jgi:hypothetical protein
MTAIALRQNAMASAGATAYAIVGPEVETASTATASATEAGTRGREGIAWKCYCDNATVAGLVTESMRRAAVAWIEVPGHGPAVVWCVWMDEALYVVSGGAEQTVPGLAETHTATVTARGDHGGAIVTWPATVTRVTPDSPQWPLIAPALAAKRLNSAPAPDLCRMWAAGDATINQLTPV